jgi:uncharacterized surface protein with fasciclin (FAS1) repeats
MNKLMTTSLIVAVAFGVSTTMACSTCGCTAPTTCTLSHQTKLVDIVHTAQHAGKFSTLVAALEAAGLDDALQSPGPFTVFAPTDKAFAALPKGTVEQFLYVAEQLNQYNLGFLHIMDGLAFGFHELGEPVTLSEFRQVYQGLLMGNCGYTKEAAEAVIKKGDADLIAFGRPYISNPDLVERFANDWPLAPEADMASWYNADLGAQGYTSFPTYRQ